MASLEKEDPVLAEIVKLRTEVQELKLFITGDKFRGLVGVMDILETHRRELYGNEPTLEVGLKRKQEEDHKRIKDLEKDRVRLVALSTGVSGTVAILYGLAKSWLGK
jgi:hypothetical protein